MDTLKSIDFTDEEKQFVSSLINRFGTGQHPICDQCTFNGFSIDYLKSITWQPKFKKTSFSDDGMKLINSIKEKLFNTF